MLTKTESEQNVMENSAKDEGAVLEKKSKGGRELIKPLPLRSDSVPNMSSREPVPNTTNTTISGSNNTVSTSSSSSTTNSPKPKVNSPQFKGIFSSSPTIYCSSVRTAATTLFGDDEEKIISPRASPNLSPKEHTKESPKGNEQRKQRSNSLVSRRKKTSQSQEDLKINIGFFIAPHFQRKSAPNLDLDNVIRKNCLKEAKKYSHLDESVFIKTKDGDQIIVLPASDNKKEKLSKYYYVKRDVSFGIGGTGEVVAGIDLKSGEIIAMRFYKNKVHKTAFREHDNLVRMDRCYGLVENYESLIMLMKYYPGINFLHYLYHIDPAKTPDDLDYCVQKKSIPPQLIIKIVYKLLEQVQKLHENHLLHRDIKSENFIINFLKDDLEMTLVDLVDAINDDEESNVYCGTPGYIHPDLFGGPKERKNYNPLMDYYQLAIVIAELLTSCNYQKKIKEKMKQYKDDGFVQDITPKMIFSMMPDVFSSSATMSQNNFDKTIPTAYSLLYDHYVFGVLQQLVMKLIHPGDISISLQGEIDKLMELERVYYSCAKTMIQLSLDSFKLFSTLSTSMETFGVNTTTKGSSQTDTFLHVFMTLMNKSFTDAKEYSDGSPEHQRRLTYT